MVILVHGELINLEFIYNISPVQSTRKVTISPRTALERAVEAKNPDEFIKTVALGFIIKFVNNNNITISFEGDDYYKGNTWFRQDIYESKLKELKDKVEKLRDELVLYWNSHHSITVKLELN